MDINSEKIWNITNYIVLKQITYWGHTEDLFLICS